jgi:hypothetical protein
MAVDLNSALISLAEEVEDILSAIFYVMHDIACFEI